MSGSLFPLLLGGEEFRSAVKVENMVRDMMDEEAKKLSGTLGNYVRQLKFGGFLLCAVDARE